LFKELLPFSGIRHKVDSGFAVRPRRFETLFKGYLILRSAMALRLIKPELVSLIYLTVGGIGPGDCYQIW